MKLQLALAIRGISVVLHDKSVHHAECAHVRDRRAPLCAQRGIDHFSKFRVKPRKNRFHIFQRNIRSRIRSMPCLCPLTLRRHPLRFLNEPLAFLCRQNRSFGSMNQAEHCSTGTLSRTRYKAFMVHSSSRTASRIENAGLRYFNSVALHVIKQQHRLSVLRNLPLRHHQHARPVCTRSPSLPRHQPCRNAAPATQQLRMRLMTATATNTNTRRT
mmetsp:Transcript_17348/g.37673  ORF Transcript_17348/g.37673 Transcript_17348/m.37673 type:complete len:215 (-) Transcript_17348:67-711(-)